MAVYHWQMFFGSYSLFFELFHTRIQCPLLLLKLLK